MASWSLAAPRKRMAQEFRSLYYEFYLFGIAFRSHYDSAIADEMKKLNELEEFGGSEHANRACVAIENAARCYHSAHWWPIFMLAIRKRYRVLATIGFGLATSALAFYYLLLRPSNQDLNVYGYFVFFIVASAIVYMSSFLGTRTPYRYRTSLLLIITTAATIAVKAFQGWSPYVHSTWVATVSSFPALRPEYRAQMESVPIAYILKLNFSVIAVVCVGGVFHRLVRCCVKAIIGAPEFGQPAEECAEVVIGLLSISHSLIGSSCVRYLDYKLGRLASLIKGPWRQAMRSSYKSAGELIAGEAPRIELFIRHLQARNIPLGGDWSELRTAIMSTLVNAADGNWHLIGAEEAYADRVVAQRRTRIIRRAIAIAVSIAFAIAAPHLMRHYPALYPSIVIACILFAFGQLVPDALTALDVGGKFTNMLKRGG